MAELPEHLREKYYLYALYLDGGYTDRPSQEMMIVNLRRPVTFKTLLESYIFQHLELTIESSGKKIKTSRINGVQKIPNQNIPVFELREDGTLAEIAK